MMLRLGVLAVAWHSVYVWPYSPLHTPYSALHTPNIQMYREAPRSLGVFDLARGNLLNLVLSIINMRTSESNIFRYTI